MNKILVTLLALIGGSCISFAQMETGRVSVAALGVFLLVNGIRGSKLLKKVLGGILTLLGVLGVLSYVGVQLNVPVLQVGIPAVLSVYFDLFSSAMQAFIFCMLTTLYIANAAEE